MSNYKYGQWTPCLPTGIFCPCKKHPDFSHHLKCRHTPGPLRTMLSSLTSMLINCQRVSSCEAIFSRIISNQNKGDNRFTIWAASLLTRCETPQLSLWPYCVFADFISQENKYSNLSRNFAVFWKLSAVSINDTSLWNVWYRLRRQTKNTPPCSFHTICVKKLVNAQWVSLVMTPMTHTQRRTPPPCSGSRCALGSPSGETLPPQRVGEAQVYSSQAWMFPGESVTSPRPAASDTPTCERVFTQVLENSKLKFITNVSNRINREEMGQKCRFLVPLR